MSDIPGNIVVFILLLSGFYFSRWIFLRLLHQRYYNKWLDVILVLPGTIIHELSHFIVAALLLSKDISFSIWPRFHNNQVIYGSVSFIPRLQVFLIPISLAPLMLNIVTAWYISNLNVILPIKVYLLIAVIGAAIPSSKDFMNCFSALLHPSTWVVGIVVIVFNELIIKISTDLLFNMNTVDLTAFNGILAYIISIYLLLITFFLIFKLKQ